VNDMFMASDAQPCPIHSGDDSGAATPPCDPSCRGTCIRGRCLITLVSEQNGNANRLAIDSTSVYFTESPAGLVKKVPVGGGVVTTLATQAVPLAIAVDSTSVFWTGESGTQTGTVTRATLDGASQATIATSQINPNSIAVDATSIYWANGGTFLCNCGSIVRAALDGSSTTTLAYGGTFPSSIAVDSASVYWIENSAAVLEMPLSGGPPSILASVPGRFVGIQGALAIDATAAYWAQPGHGVGDGTILKVPLTGGSVTTLASGQCFPGSITVDTTSVYWTTYGTGTTSGTVVKAALDGSGMTTLASEQAPSAIAVDATSVYWANTVGPSIMKLTPK
jgi:hypothetical protein